MIAATLLLYLLLMETVFPKADWMLIIIINIHLFSNTVQCSAAHSARAVTHVMILSKLEHSHPSAKLRGRLAAFVFVNIYR